MKIGKEHTILDTIKQLFNKYKYLIKFGIVGVINTGVDFGAFTLLTKYGEIDAYTSQIAGYSAGVINSFVLNKLWTFENKKKGAETGVQLLQFIVINVLSLGISLLGLKVLNGQFGMNVYLAKVIITVLAQIVNYLGYKLWIFKA